MKPPSKSLRVKTATSSSKQKPVIVSPPTEPKERDFVGIAKAYAKRAADEKNRDKFGRWIRLAAQRFIRDLERAKDPQTSGFRFEPERAAHVCVFIELLPHVEGIWDTPDIVLHESDVFFLVNLFGFRKLDGTRRFTTALKAVARKNAKSTIAAAIGIYCETSEGEQGPQVVAAATTGSQARIVFNIAKRMVEKTPDLREAFEMKAFANAIICSENGGVFKPINAKASTQDGLNPSATILDEIHAHKSHDLINVLRSAAGARSNPLFLYTTTEGYETPGPWPEIRHFAKQVLERVVEADHFLICYYALDEQMGKQGEADFQKADDDFDEAKWPKANPLMSVNKILLNEIRKEAIEAKGMPGRLGEFRIKRLNRPSSTSQGWITLPKWQACSGEVDLKWLEKYPCDGGLDLASTRDLTSFRLAWNVEGRWYTHGWRFVPRSAIFGRSERGLVPYQGWVAAGYLIQAGDEVTDYDELMKCVLQARERFNLRSVAYDTWNAAQVASKLSEKNIKMVQFIQGARSFHPAMKELEHAYISGKINHGNDPVLNWCASNLIARRDENMNTAPDRKRSPDKIDDMVALLMAIGMSIAPEDKPKEPQLMFV